MSFETTVLSEREILLMIYEKLSRLVELFEEDPVETEEEGDE